LENIDGVAPYTIVFKPVDSNIFDPPSEKEKEIFAKTIADLDPDLVGIRYDVISCLYRKRLKSDCSE
jgi:hypothetical protein